MNYSINKTKTWTLQDLYFTLFYPEKPEANSGPADWWKVESGLTPNKLDTLIDVVNKINDVFGNYK